MTAPRFLSEWTVDYGDGSPLRAVQVPHAWRQDVPLAYEGPVVYRAEPHLPKGHWILRFHGVSYRAEVHVDGKVVADHRGIWDAFEVPVEGHGRTRTHIEVRVTKNGGASFPIAETLGGVLPCIFGTFGGIYREVEVLAPGDAKIRWIPEPRLSAGRGRLLLDRSPFYVRGVAHQGWYPDLGHPNPPSEQIETEIEFIRSLGLNLVKFSGWVPSHGYLEALDQAGLVAWLDLPGGPEADDELDRIVRQYRVDRAIVLWTVAGKEDRRVSNLAGSELSGLDIFQLSGDPLSTGPSLDRLSPAVQPRRPALISFYGVEVHRDLARLGDELPYWASALPELNERGSRVRDDLARVAAQSRFSLHPTASGHKRLMASSQGMVAFAQSLAAEEMLQRPNLCGSVWGTLRDTPVAARGLLDDWGDPRIPSEEFSEPSLFLIRGPVEADGLVLLPDALNHFEGDVRFAVGCHCSREMAGGAVWTIVDSSGVRVLSGAEEPLASDPAVHGSRVIARVRWADARLGEYRLHVEYGPADKTWPIWIVPKKPIALRAHDPEGLLAGLGGHSGPLAAVRDIPEERPALAFLTAQGTIPKPFWTGAAYEFRGDIWDGMPFADRWERLLPVSTDRVLDLEVLGDRFGEEPEILMNRIDTATYEEHAVMARFGPTLVTSLRPWGGLGFQPSGIERNPAGWTLLNSLLSL